MTTPAAPILAIDPALRTGWAHSSGASGALRLAGKGHPGLAHLRLANHVARLIKTLGCGLLAFETAPFHGRNRQAAVLAKGSELRGVLLVVAARLEVPIVTVNPTTLKCWATGSGRAKKDQMQAAYARFYDEQIDDPDICDALWVLRFAEHWLARGGRVIVPTKKSRSRRRSPGPRSLFRK